MRITSNDETRFSLSLFTSLLPCCFSIADADDREGFEEDGGKVERDFSNSFTATAPFSATSTRCPNRLNNIAAIFKIVGESSTNRIEQTPAGLCVADEIVEDKEAEKDAENVDEKEEERDGEAYIGNEEPDANEDVLEDPNEDPNEDANEIAMGGANRRGSI
jgi:hypothetical protein